MYRIALVNMPLANLSMPSLALTQLEAVVGKVFGREVESEIHYLSHDFARFVGLPAHDELISFDHHPSGLGDWFFRAVAFPDEPDNSEAYFQRYYPNHAPHSRAIRELVAEKRTGLAAHFEEMIGRYDLDQAHLVGFTSMFSQNVATLAMARMIRARNPEVVVVVGGANCEGVMGRELIEHARAADFVCSGPSLRSFPALVRALIDGDADGCDRIDGVFSRRNRVEDAACGSVAMAAPGGAPAVRSFGEENDINEL
ncbi:MAG TPA: hypothetical protein VEX86_14720, partial [Longimicrobium sp.]|nr:hypothetical protein [Longimicrobium sp.]